MKTAKRYYCAAMKERFPIRWRVKVCYEAFAERLRVSYGPALVLLAYAVMFAAVALSFVSCTEYRYETVAKECGTGKEHRSVSESYVSRRTHLIDSSYDTCEFTMKRTTVTE